MPDQIQQPLPLTAEEKAALSLKARACLLEIVNPSSPASPTNALALYYKAVHPNIVLALLDEASALRNQLLLRDEEARKRGTYIQTEKALPEEGRTVLLQPKFDWALPEFGRMKRDEHGPYWEVNGQRSTRYDISNWKGWANLPNEPAAASIVESVPQSN